MVDNDVRGMVRALAGGDLASAAPLLDRLEELGDIRRESLLLALGRLTRDARDIGAMTASRQRSTREKMAYRRDERSYECWRMFVGGLRDNFWLEMGDESLADALARTARDMAVPKQAERLASAQADVTEEYAEEDMVPMANTRMGSMWG